MKENIIEIKSKSFAKRIVLFCRYLSKKTESPILSQLIRSGTSIGANVHEAMEGYSKKDFYSKLSIALKEARETEYWLDLLYNLNDISKDEFTSINQDCSEIISILVAIKKTQRQEY